MLGVKKMIISNTIPFTMSPTQVAVVFRDICKAINYQSCDKEIAYSTSSSVISSGWSDLPEWIGVVELQLLENEVKLIIDVSSEVAPHRL